MQHLFTPEGDAALAAAMQLRPLMAFDFDGTLAHIVAHPDDARISQGVAMRLKRLATRLPVAIVTGRAADDVRERLGFKPHYVVGNHGSEDAADPHAASECRAALDPLRASLAAHGDAFAAAGVLVEDKGQSIALHYRLSRDRDVARAMIEELLAPQQSSLHVFAGKMVVNVTGADAPDKADAVRALMLRSGARAAFFAGDDVNDEPVFEAAAPDWLTVRVGAPEVASHARFYLHGPQEMALLLDRALGLLG
ncbi:MAG: trehalose-phosphatase [Rhizobacter sp.]|nr:trehalose-phosphatase [Rhizobacter sp.]